VLEVGLGRPTARPLPVDADSPRVNWSADAQALSAEDLQAFVRALSSALRCMLSRATTAASAAASAAVSAAPSPAPSPGHARRHEARGAAPAAPPLAPPPIRLSATSKRVPALLPLSRFDVSDEGRLARVARAAEAGGPRGSAYAIFWAPGERSRARGGALSPCGSLDAVLDVNAPAGMLAPPVPAAAPAAAPERRAASSTLEERAFARRSAAMLVDAGGDDVPACFVRSAAARAVGVRSLLLLPFADGLLEVGSLAASWERLPPGLAHALRASGQAAAGPGVTEAVVHMDAEGEHAAAEHTAVAAAAAAVVSGEDAAPGQGAWRRQGSRASSADLSAAETEQPSHPTSPRSTADDWAHATADTVRKMETAHRVPLPVAMDAAAASAGGHWAPEAEAGRSGRLSQSAAADTER